eukprot:scaffold10570_cov176-Amphora_coffeaeformis.AAC.5
MTVCTKRKGISFFWESRKVFVGGKSCRPDIPFLFFRLSLAGTADTSSSPSSLPSLLPVTIGRTNSGSDLNAAQIEQPPHSAGASFPALSKRRRRGTHKKARPQSAFVQLFPWSMSTQQRGASSKIQSSLRTESMAYPSSATANLISKAQYYARRYDKTLMVIAGVLLFGLLLAATSSPSSSMKGVGVLRGSKPSYFGGAVRLGYFFPEDAVNKKENKFYFAAVTDLDELSKVETEKKPTFRSILMPGTLTQLVKDNGKVTYSIDMDMANPRELITKHNEAGRGAEFSELQLFQNR